MENFQFTFESYLDSRDLQSRSYRGSSPTSASLTESLKTVHLENGRTYHSYRKGSYPFPNDQQEIERLEFQYEVIKDVLGRGYFAPLTQTNPPREILDIGTGTGQWAIEIADEFPEAQVIGTDLSPIQPAFVPQNCKFYIEDSSDEWDYHFDFDYIHTRATLGSWSDMRTQIVEKSLAHLRPGGWLECQEVGGTFDCDDGTMPDDWQPAAWMRDLNEAAEAAGRPIGAPRELRRWFEEAGFVDVQERVFKLPVGVWSGSNGDNVSDDLRRRHVGALWLRNLENGLSALTYALGGRVLGMSKEEMEVWLVDIRRELRNPKVHAYQSFFVVWGRKPMPGESS